jgi:hypothetical protein
MAYSNLISCLRMLAEGAADYLSNPKRSGAAGKFRSTLAAARPFLVKSDGYEPGINATRAAILKKCDEVAVAIQRSHLRVVTVQPARCLTNELCEELLGLVETLMPELAEKVR